MKTSPPPAPSDLGGETNQMIERPLFVKEGVEGGPNRIHNKEVLTARRKELRNNATSAEQQLWRVIQNRQLAGLKFRRQHSIGYYILDFYCPEERLAIELDGDSHFSDEAIAYDQERTAFLNALNVRVLRFANTDVYDHLDAVCTQIIEKARTGCNLKTLPPPTPPETGGETNTSTESPLLVKEGVGGGPDNKNNP